MADQHPPPPGPPPSGPSPSGPPSGPPSGLPPSGPPPTHPPPAYPPPAHGWAPPPPPPTGKRHAWIAVALALLLVALAAAAAVVVPRLGEGESDEPGTTSTLEVDLDDVRVSEPQPGHRPGDLDYPDSPPVGGLHNDIWLDCGVYDEPVPEENVVHDLEHGTVWITYEPGLDSDEVGALEDALPQNGILSPYPGLSAPVVVTVWGRQLDLSGADDPRLKLFIEEFGEGVTAPEPFASCAGGAEPDQLDELELGGPGTDV